MENHEGGNSGQQRQKCPKQRRASKEIYYENNMMNLTRHGRATLMLVTPQNKRPLTTIPENSVVVFDNTCHDYDLVRSGCITEERLKPNNRLYKYYYDPLEKMYNTRYAADCMCANMETNCELIFLNE